MRPAAIALAVFLAFALCAASVTRAGNASFKVIVNPDSSISSVDREFLRDAYLKKTPTWSNGATIRPIDLTRKFAVRDQFSRDVLKKSPAQLKSYWNQQVFSGKGVPPPEVDAIADVIAYVLANPGAIGYLPADSDPGGAKVVEVR
jgi:ABC-type phosphate transport system substrate-binding protein